MLLKVLNGFSQAAIITLAFVLIITITNKHTSNIALEDFQRQMTEALQADKKYYDNRIKTVEDNLNTYQQTREARAQLYGKRLDELYNLYKKDPSPIDQGAGKIVGEQVARDTQPESLLNKNFSFFETKYNNLDEKIDNNNNKVDNRLNILEQRVNGITSQSKNSNVKVVQNNIQTVNNNK